MHSPNDVSHDHPQTQRAVTSRLHPRVYTIAAGLAAWLVLSVWLFASGGSEVDYLLFIVSGFIFMAVALPFTLSLVARDRTATPELDTRESYNDWAKSQYDTSQGRLSGRAAAVQILLPIAAVSIGMTLFGIALHIARHEGPQQPVASYSSGSVVKNNG